MIFCRVLERTSGGKDLSWKFLKEMIIEELNIIKINQPDRDFARISCKNGNIIEMTYVRRFAERNNLSRFLLQKFTKPNRNFECDICGSRFTMKNVLEAHRKRIHFSFLQWKYSVQRLKYVKGLIKIEFKIWKNYYFETNFKGISLSSIFFSGGNETKFPSSPHCTFPPFIWQYGVLHHCLLGEFRKDLYLLLLLILKCFLKTKKIKNKRYLFFGKFHVALDIVLNCVFFYKTIFV